MLEIKSNGSKWYGEALDTIDQLIEVMASYPLDPVFEKYGNYVFPFRPSQGWNTKNEHYKGCTCFFGNFYTYSHVFNIITDEPEVIEHITAAIRANQATEAYKQARTEHEDAERAKEERQAAQLRKLQYGI